ncbi:MAG TPA: hypothetical protein VD970_00315 [Acetobacteraceae bacterium]|nr:hypothetical protein [Acetobacteraceae bacterium]
MRRTIPFLAALLATPVLAQPSEGVLRAFATTLFGALPADVTVQLHPMPWGAAPPAAGVTHVLVAQNNAAAALALVALPEGETFAPRALAMGRAPEPGICETPPGMPEADVLGDFAAARDESSSLAQPIVLPASADGAALIGLTWRVGERRAAAQATMLFRLDGAQLREAGCFVTRLDAVIGVETAAGATRRRNVSSVWRIEPGPDARTPLLLRDSARPQRPVAVRPDAAGRYGLVVPEERETGRRR